VPHATIQLLQNDEPLIQATMIARSTSWLWHKERLLNLLAQRLIREGFDKIIWLDGDIEFLDPDWFKRTVDAMDDYTVVQPFTRYEREKEGTFTGAIFRWVQGKGMQSRGSGFACGINIDLWKKGLYEYGIVGGGDVLFLQGCVYGEKHWLQRIKMNSFVPRHNKEYIAHYLAWCKTLGPQSLACVDGTVRTFWHGSIPDRKYMRRHEPLKTFNPTDLRLNDDGVFEWSKNSQNDYIRKYMFNRKEDGCTQT